MKGRALLRSAFNETKDCCCVTVGAKAEADAERRARTAADFIMVILLYLKFVVTGRKGVYDG